MSAKVTWKAAAIKLGMIISFALGLEDGVLAQEEEASSAIATFHRIHVQSAAQCFDRSNAGVVRPLYGSLPKKTVAKALDFADQQRRPMPRNSSSRL